MIRLRTVPAAFVATLACAMLPTAALAHPGHGPASFAGGLLHPLAGADHLAAMLLVGLWAGLIGTQAAWRLPAAFLAGMALGLLLGSVAHLQAGATLAEGVIVASVAALGAAVAWRAQVALLPAMAVVGLFGMAHGVMHGIEGRAVGGFAVGVLASTALLHGLGLFLARHLPARLVRSGGALGAGAALLVIAAG